MRPRHGHTPVDGICKRGNFGPIGVTGVTFWE